MYSSSYKAGKKAAISFFLLPEVLTFRGPKKSIPAFEIASATCRRSAGRPTIKGGSGFTLLLLQYEHQCRIFLTDVRQRRI